MIVYNFAMFYCPTPCGLEINTGVLWKVKQSLPKTQY